jgi:hypothetical protein
MAARSSRLCRWHSWLILNSIGERTAARVLDILAEKYPQAYFGGVVALAKSIRWETAEEDLSGGGMTPEEIMEKLEQRVGPEGRKLFERFLRDVNKLQAQQQLEAQAQTGDNGGR